MSDPSPPDPDKYPRVVRRYRRKDWPGLRGDDLIVEHDPDRQVFIRDGELIIVSDEPVDITI